MTHTEQVLVAMYALANKQTSMQYESQDGVELLINFMGNTYTFTLDRSYADTLSVIQEVRFTKKYSLFEHLEYQIKNNPKDKSATILKLNKQGMSIRNIAKLLNISKTTVVYYIEREKTPAIIKQALKNPNVIKNIEAKDGLITVTPNSGPPITVNISDLPTQVVDKLVKKFG